MYKRQHHRTGKRHGGADVLPDALRVDGELLGQGTIKVALKYDSVNKVNAIKKLERVSSPGMRKSVSYTHLDVYKRQC